MEASSPEEHGGKHRRLDRHKHIRDDAAKALGVLCDPRAVEPFAKLLKVAFRLPAAEALAMLGDDRGFDYLLKVGGNEGSATLHGMRRTAQDQGCAGGGTPNGDAKGSRCGCRSCSDGVGFFKDPRAAGDP